MPQYDDPLWTVIVFAVIVLTGMWAYSRRDKISSAGGAANSTQLKNNGLPANSEDTSHENVSGDSVDERYKTERAIRNWTAVLAISGVFAAIFAAFTLSSIRGQLDEMRSERRPWI